MPQHSQRFGFDLPDDFPLALLEDVHAKASDIIYPAQIDVWKHWAGGCNGTMYRFMAAADASEAWVSTYTDRPSVDEHVAQDQLLFQFFVSALSSLECLAFGLCAIGEYVRPSAFPVSSKPQAITFEFAVRAFSAEFPSDPLAVTLDALQTSTEMKDLRDTRNILAHRAAPGRVYAESAVVSPSGDTSSIGSTTWLGAVLGTRTTAEPREWTATGLTEILGAAKSFVDREL